METISTLCAIIVGIAMFVTPVLFVIFLIRWAMKKTKKKIGIAALIGVGCFILFSIVGAFTSPGTYCDHEYYVVSEDPATCEEKGTVSYHCDLCGYYRTEKIDALGHDMSEVSRKEPTEDVEGEIVCQCTRCGVEDVTVIAKLPKPTEAIPSVGTTEPYETTEPIPTETTEIELTETEPTPTEPTATFEVIYKAYKSNELVADDLYKGNRYRVTAIINGIETGGLFNMTGGATLTMQTQVGNTIVFFYAEFEKEQEEALKQVAVGDMITFDGTCLSAGSWIDCEIVG